MPSVICCWALVLVAALCAVLFGAAAGQRVPQAVVDSQQQLVSGLARVLDNAYEATVDGLADAADRYDGGIERDPAKLLAGLDDGMVRWVGSAVVDGKTRQPVAARGQPVPVALVVPKGGRPTFRPLLQGNEPRILAAVPLQDGRLLAGLSVLRVRQLRLDPNQQQAVLVGMTAKAAGKPEADVRHVQGADPSKDAGIMATVRRAVDATAGGDRASRTQPGPEETVLVVVAAAVGDSDLAVASAVRTPLVWVGPRWMGVPPAIGLLIAVGVAFGLLRLGLVQPIRRLLAVAKASATGDTRRVGGRPVLSETKRITAALRGTKRRRGIPAIFGVVAATLVVVFWAVVTGITYGGGASEVPAQVVKDSGNQIESVSIALGDVLDSGRAQLAAAARTAAANPNTLRSTLDRLADQDSRYRSIYLADAAGKSVLRVGRDPLRQQRPLPGDSGVRLDNDSGRLPVIYAHTRTADGRSLVAEYDVGFLARLLQRIDGHVRVVDAQLRTILDTEGYRAFQQIPAGPSRAALAEGTTQTTADVLRTAGGWNPVLVSHTPLSTPATTKALKWTVVAELPVSQLALPPNDLRRAALLSGGAAIVLAFASLGWHYFVLLRPLRRLAVAADKLVAGDTETVISPQRPDEIGAIASCLDICRQVRVDGEWRLGGAVRLRPDDMDVTTVMPIIRPRKKEPVGR